MKTVQSVWAAIAVFLELSNQLITAKAGSVTTCNTTSAAAGQTALVTCFFPVDVKSVRPVVLNVEHYPAGGLQTGEEILECKWLEGPYEMDCHLKAGFTVNGPEGSQLYMQVNAMSEQVAGHYACKMMTPRMDTAGLQTCHLNLLPPPGEHVEPGGDGEDLEKLENIQENDETDHTAQTAGIAVGVCAAVVIVGIIVAAVVKRRRKKLTEDIILEGDPRGRSSGQCDCKSACTRWLTKHGRHEDGMESGQESEYARKRQMTESLDDINDSYVSKQPYERQTLVEETKRQTCVAPSERQSLVEPSERKTLVEPSERQSLVAPSERQSLVEPSERQSFVAPSERQSLVEPSERPSLVGGDDHAGKPVSPTLNTSRPDEEAGEVTLRIPATLDPIPSQRTRATSRSPLAGNGIPDQSVTEEGLVRRKVSQPAESDFTQEIELRSAGIGLGVKQKIDAMEGPYGTVGTQRAAGRLTVQEVFSLNA